MVAPNYLYASEAWDIYSASAGCIMTDRNAYGVPWAAICSDCAAEHYRMDASDERPLCSACVTVAASLREEAAEAVLFAKAHERLRCHRVSAHTTEVLCNIVDAFVEAHEHFAMLPDEDFAAALVGLDECARDALARKTQNSLCVVLRAKLGRLVGRLSRHTPERRGGAMGLLILLL